MKAFVISLARTPERLAEFHRRNQSVLACDVFPAVDGRDCAPQELVRAGVFDGTVAYAPGAVGNALSHLRLWERVLEADEPATICEDDAIFHPGFAVAAERLLARLDGDWDFVAWGWNFDSILLAELVPGLGRCLMGFDQAAMRRGMSDYLAGEVNPSLLRLIKSFGTVCYAISPRGARRLRAKVLPIRRMDLQVPGLQRTLPNTALDVMLNHFYRELDAFVAFPPLVVTCNEHAESTVQTGDAPRAR
jgi:GR25 family glycosyltransferase involved in LPS biosynthesis